jgi:chromosomal replication initiator protein
VDRNTAWSSVLDFVRARTKPQQFETWFPSLRCLAFEPELVRVGAPNDFYKKWIENHYLGLLREGCFEVLGTEPRIELAIIALPVGAAVAPAAQAVSDAAATAKSPGLAPRSLGSGEHPSLFTAAAYGTQAPAMASAGSSVPVSAAGPTPEIGVATLTPPSGLPAAPALIARPTPRTIGDVRLNPQYVFEEFVVGPSNRLAHAAALAVTENPAHTYNPLFLHGGVGLGKTHLLQAVCHALLTKNPNLVVVYLSCEAFVNQYIASIQKGDPDTFRNRYRHVDMLLLDDIHFLASKKVMQEEFFHTFNHLYNAQKQIILSSDSPPQDIPDLEARLVSRFKWGLVAEIEPPHYETKVAIIKSKARARGRELPDDVVDYLANALDSNIRELEGAVLKIIVLAGLQNQKVDVPLCQQAVKELTSRPDQVNLSDIMTAVATHFHLKVSDLLSKKRSKSVALPRQICMYLGRMLTPLSLEEIGGQFGGRDHTTVLYAEGKIRDMREKNPEVRGLLERLSRELRRA